MENKNLKNEILKGVKVLLVEQKTDILDDVDKKFDGMAVLINKNFQSNQDYMDKKFEQVDKRFEQVDKRFDKVEKLILSDHRERIEKLEIEVKELKDLLAFK